MTLTALSLTAAAPARAGDNPATDLPGRVWQSAGNGARDDHSAPFEHAISRQSVASLRQRWVFTTTGDVPNIPTVEPGAVYSSDSGGSVWRIDPVTGKAVWQVSIPELTNDPMNYARTSPAIAPSVVIVGDQGSGTVFALDKHDGHVVWKTRLSTAQKSLISSSPLILDGRVYVGVSSMQEELASTQKGFVPDFRGQAVALDLADGHVIWRTFTVPEGYTGGAVWGSNLAGDELRGLVFVTTGDNYSVPSGVSACELSSGGPGVSGSCLAGDDHIDSVLALDWKTGAVKWSRRLTKYDTWTVSCIPSAQPPATPCPNPAGKDYDFGSAANLFTATIDGHPRDLVGAGQKSGVYWAFDRDTGRIVWMTQVNPGGTRGGIEWGSAVDSKRVYVAAANSKFLSVTLRSGVKTNGGWWSALDSATGQILWETPTLAAQPPVTKTVRGTPPPPGARARTEGALTTANGVVFGGDTAGNFVALDGLTGHVLWTVQSGGSVISAPAIVDGKLYWGSGYGDIGTANSKLIALELPEAK